MYHKKSLLLNLGLVVSIGISVGCSNLSKKKGGKDLGTQAVEPPVTANTPAGLLAVLSLAGPDSKTAISEIKDRLFSPGPTYTRQYLKDVDGRMAGYASREKTEHHDCVDAVPLEVDMTVPVALNFPHYLQCIESWNGNAGWSAFGIKDGVTYVREGMATGMGKVAKVDADSNVEAWVYVGDKGHIKDMSQALMHLKSTKASGVLEFTVTGSGVGVGCGVQMRSNAKYIYLAGTFADANGPNACDTVAAEEFCLNSADLVATDTTNCTDAGLTTFEMEGLTPAFVASADVYKIGAELPTGIASFETAPTTTE